MRDFSSIRNKLTRTSEITENELRRGPKKRQHEKAKNLFGSRKQKFE
jgi:hypothetical protein